MRKCGYVALVGRPNAGKSTLLNRLVGEKVAIVSDKPQTTRHRILGILTLGNRQMVFVDTPGIHRPGYRLNERMMEAVYGTLREVDVVVHVVDSTETYGKGSDFAVDLMRSCEAPVILALNKADAINKGRLLPQIESYASRSVYQEIVPISALNGDNVDDLLEVTARLLPERDFLFPEDLFTNQLERTMVAEVIREKVLLHTRQELPYSTAVKLELFDESRRYPAEEDTETLHADKASPSFVRIAAVIIVDKPSQKKIVIGRGARMVKQIGIESRQELERFLGVDKIFLELHVKTVPGWRDSDHLLDELGTS